MNFIKRLLSAYARSADPSPEAEARLRERLLARAQSPDAERAHSRALLRALPAADPWAEKRLERRVRATVEAPRSARRPALVLTGAGALAAAIALLVAPRWSDPPEALPPAAIALLIDTSGRGAEDIPLAPEVALHVEGRGHAGGTEQAPLIEWEEGQLSVEVTPDRGVDLVVRTPEAVVTVVGTGFTVDRGALGTRVSVRHGKVQVDCAVGSSHLLGADASVECAPTRPAALLGRARAQAARGDDADAVLSTLDAATRSDTPAPVAGEVLALRVEVLRAAGRSAEALESARAYLAAGHTPRRAEIRHIAASILLDQGGCRAAYPLLAEAVAEGGDAADLAALAACKGR